MSGVYLRYWLALARYRAAHTLLRAWPCWYTMRWAWLALIARRERECDLREAQL